MTELALPDDNHALPATGDEQQPAPAPQQLPPTPESSALLLWAQEARQAAQVAHSIAKTSFAGALRGKPEEVTAVILAGNELGLKPMAALKSIDVIQGTPALRAHAMRALVLSAGHEIELVDDQPRRLSLTELDGGDDTAQ